MNAEALARALIPGVIVSFDTNAALGSTILDAARKLAIINIKVQLSVIMVGEHIHQAHRRWQTRDGTRRESFDINRQFKALQNHNIEIVSIDEEDAKKFHDLAFAAPNWQEEKRALFQRILSLKVFDDNTNPLPNIEDKLHNLPAETAEKQIRHLLSLSGHEKGIQLPGKWGNRSVPATADWWIRAQAERRGWIMVTDDTHTEWKNLPNKVSKSVFDSVLSTIPLPTGPALIPPPPPPSTPSPPESQSLPAEFPSPNASANRSSPE